MGGESVRCEYHPLVKAIVRALRRRCGVGAGAKLLVAVSGGADSVALLRALAVIAPRRTWQLELVVGYAQHNLRPAEEGEQDSFLVRGLADELGLPLLRADLDVATTGDNVEAAARRQRYEALADMAESCGASFVATGHHGDDQLETVLMRLLRGASVKGMAGIAWRRPLTGSKAALIRPMLATDRAMVGNFLEVIGQPWREDRTNTDLSRWRARLRHDVLPVLRQIRPDAAQKAVQLAEHMTEAWHVLAEAIGNAVGCVDVGDGVAVIDRGEARSMPRVVLTGVLRRLLSDAGTAKDKLGRRNVSPIVRAIRDTKGGCRTFDLGAGGKVTITRTEVRIESLPSDCL